LSEIPNPSNSGHNGLSTSFLCYLKKFIFQGRGDNEEPGREFSKEEHLAQSHALAQVILILTQNLTTLSCPQI
jgi:hypothetical protein